MDEASAAQTIESPCTPRSGVPYNDLASVFTVNVTEMAKLGPEPLRYITSRTCSHVFISKLRHGL
jgi:hypothetical protein